MANLAIKGHTTRGKEVIELLEMLGGYNSYTYEGCEQNSIFTISNYSAIINVFSSTNYAIFTLEEFLEKFPYKVGDKVSVYEYESKVQIDDMKWDGNEVQYEVFTDETEWYSAEELNKYNEPYKEETMEEKVKSFEILESHCADEVKIEFDPSKFEIVERENGYYVVRKKPQYPKTYVECAKILNCFGAAHIDGYKCELLEKFQELLICRNAYWKIAGDWNPDYKNPNKDTFYFLFNNGECIEKWQAQYPINKVLIFPTEEMRDAFYENFKNEIEQCKELW